MGDDVNCAGVGSTGFPFLPNTGLPLALMLTLAGACLVAGIAVILLARTRRSRTSTGVVVLLLVAGGLATGFARPEPARAATPPCATPVPAVSNSLTIRQTSTMTGLGPGVAPAAITGVVVNHGNDSTYVTSVTVSMVSVTKTLIHAPGTCDTGDYLLTDVTMPVDQMLEPGQSADFGGARISFRDKSTNQDACQGATIGLRYVSS